jgi:hypothetical protein
VNVTGEETGGGFSPPEGWQPVSSGVRRQAAATQALKDARQGSAFIGVNRSEESLGRAVAADGTHKEER